MVVWLKALTLWFVILLLAIINGTLREKALIPLLGNAAGLVASGAILAACIFFVAWIGAPWYGVIPSQRWLLIGGFWLLLTVVFEFSFGRIAQQKTWAELMEAYMFKGGNIWPLVLLATFIAPWLAGKGRGLH